MRKVLISILIILVAGALLVFFWGDLRRIAFAPQDQEVPVGVIGDEEGLVQVVAEGLSVPWDAVFTLSGNILVTERTGTLAHIWSDSGEIDRIPVPEIASRGEGGLLGIALHPRVEENSWLYLYETYQPVEADSASGGTLNRVVRYEFVGSGLKDPKVIIDGIPGAPYHDGGRIDFGPDGFLYITTGDAGTESLAQDINSLAGKILRLHYDGAVPEDNPFDNAVYSYGHRNPQGLAWDEEGRLWSTEHGRSGLRSGFDELNLIESGENYGWPVIQGDEARDGMRVPVLHSGPDTTWAPASALFYEGSIFWGGLRGEALYEVKVTGTSVEGPVRHFAGEYGRIRTVVSGPDGDLYFTTSNTDGRGEVSSGDDKLIRISPSILDLDN